MVLLTPLSSVCCSTGRFGSFSDVSIVFHGTVTVMLAWFPTDVSETVEEGHTLRQPRSSDDVGNAIATGRLIYTEDVNKSKVCLQSVVRSLKLYNADNFHVLWRLVLCVPETSCVTTRLPVCPFKVLI